MALGTRLLSSQLQVRMISTASPLLYLLTHLLTKDKSEEKYSEKLLFMRVTNSNVLNDAILTTPPPVPSTSMIRSQFFSFITNILAGRFVRD